MDKFQDAEANREFEEGYEDTIAPPCEDCGKPQVPCGHDSVGKTNDWVCANEACIFGDDLEILERPLAIDPDEFGLDENEKIQFYKSFNEVKP